MIVQSALVPKFQALERMLAARRLYTGPIDNDWGDGVDRAIAALTPRPTPVPGAPATPQPFASKLPKGYEWLAREEMPPLLAAALPLLGTIEAKGGTNNETILAWADEVGLERVYTADSIAWCGLMQAVAAKRAGYKLPVNPLWALNWNTFGEPIGQPGLGDVLTFTRESGGHVADYIGEDRDAFHILGGNQGDAVTIVRIAKKRLSQARHPLGAPHLGPRILAANGVLSTNEA